MMIHSGFYLTRSVNRLLRTATFVLPVALWLQSTAASASIIQVGSYNFAPGGTLDLQNNILEVTNGSISIPAGFTLSGGAGSGIIDNVTNAGTIHFDNNSGTMTITGSYIQATTGKVIFDVGGPASGQGYTVLDVTSPASLEGSFQVSLADGFVPANGETFDLLQDADGISIGSSGLNINAPAGFTSSLADNNTVVQLAFTSIPEPTSLALISAAFSLFLGRRRSNPRRQMRTTR